MSNNRHKQVKRKRLDDNDKKDVNNNENYTSVCKKPRREELNTSINKNATFMEGGGIPGVVCVQDQPRLRELQKKVQNMCDWVSGGFPGSQPVSMDSENITNLSAKPYRVSWKACGRRYMMLINKRNEIYLFDRNNSCFQVNGISFVKSTNLNEHLEDTLVDGEMVLDKYNGELIARYLIYDIIKISNLNIGKQPFFPDRLKCIEKELIEPRIRAIEKGIIHRPSEPFSIRNKEFWDIRQSASLLGEKFVKALLHNSDGLIFQPSEEPFTPGVCSEVLKWKPPKAHSIDFSMKIHKEKEHKLCLLFVGGHDQPYAQMKYTKALEDLNNKIIECTVNEIGQWEFTRVRTDKTFPNSYMTAESVMECIRNPVTKGTLLNYIACRGFPENHYQHQHQHHHQHHQQNSYEQYYFPPRQYYSHHQQQQDEENRYRDSLFAPPRKIV